MGDIFGEIGAKMTELLNSYTKKDLALIEDYMLSAIRIMQEITDKLNEKK